MRLSPEERSYKTWVFLDTNKIEFSAADSDIVGENKASYQV
jgi:hypothetical protein